METLLNTVFIRTLLDPCMQGRCVSELESLYKDFLKTLVAVCDTIPDYKSLYRILTLTLIHVRHSIENRSRAKHRLREHFLVLVAKLLDAELHLLYSRFTHPQFFQPSSSLRRYDFHLSKRYTKSDLTELLSSLSCVGFFVDSKGDAVPYVQIVAAFSELLGIELTNPHNKRMKVLDRKISAVKFLRTLSEALIEKSRK